MNKKVLLVGIDGIRSDALKTAETPVLDQLIEEGAYTYSMDRGDYTLSGPGWSTILTGVLPDKHLVIDDRFEGDALRSYPSFFELINRERSDIQLASVVNYAAINEEILKNADKVFQEISDLAVSQKAREIIREKQADVMVVQLDECDYAGHRYGFHPNSLEYLRAISRADSLLGDIIATVDSSRTEEERWMVIVTTAQGGMPDGTHGGQDEEEEVREVFCVIHAPGIRQGEMEIKTLSVDIVPTILRFLDVPVEDSWELDGKYLP